MRIARVPARSALVVAMTSVVAIGGCAPARRATATQPGVAYDIVIRNARIVDGAGTPWRTGFIDMLGHSEYALLQRPRATSEITGEVDRATFERPRQLSTGMRFVFVNGVAVIDDGVETRALPGRALRGPGAGSSGSVERD